MKASTLALFICLSSFGSLVSAEESTAEWKFLSPTEIKELAGEVTTFRDVAKLFGQWDLMRMDIDGSSLCYSFSRPFGEALELSFRGVYDEIIAKDGRGGVRAVVLSRRLRNGSLEEVWKLETNVSVSLPFPPDQTDFPHKSEESNAAEQGVHADADKPLC